MRIFKYYCIFVFTPPSTPGSMFYAASLNLGRVFFARKLNQLSHNSCLSTPTLVVLRAFVMVLNLK